MDKYISDIIGLIGLGVFGYGTYLVKPEISFICVGVILMFVAYKTAGK